MQRCRTMLGWVAVSLGVGLSASGTARAGVSVAYDQTTSMGGDVSHSKVMIKDTLFRMETEAEGTRSIVIRNPRGIFNYFPDEGRAMKLPMLTPAQRPMHDVTDYSDHLKQMEAKQVGAEVINGYPCDVYEFTDRTAVSALRRP